MSAALFYQLLTFLLARPRSPEAGGTPAPDGRRQPNRRRAGQQADAEGRNRHGQHRPDQRLLAAEPVADPAEQGATDGTHEETGGEGPECGEQGGGRVTGGEEVGPDLLSEESKQSEVVPLEYVAHEAGDHTPAHGTRGEELLGDHAGRRDGFGDGGHGGSSWRD